jgi:hypothetical protein
MTVQFFCSDESGKAASLSKHMIISREPYLPYQLLKRNIYGNIYEKKKNLDKKKTSSPSAFNPVHELVVD